MAQIFPSSGCTTRSTTSVLYLPVLHPLIMRANYRSTLGLTVLMQSGLHSQWHATIKITSRAPRMFPLEDATWTLHSGVTTLWCNLLPTRTFYLPLRYNSEPWVVWLSVSPLYFYFSYQTKSCISSCNLHASMPGWDFHPHPGTIICMCKRESYSTTKKPKWKLWIPPTFTMPMPPSKSRQLSP